MTRPTGSPENPGRFITPVADALSHHVGRLTGIRSSTSIAQRPDGGACGYRECLSPWWWCSPRLWRWPRRPTIAPSCGTPEARVRSSAPTRSQSETPSPHAWATCPGLNVRRGPLLSLSPRMGADCTPGSSCVTLGARSGACASFFAGSGLQRPGLGRRGRDQHRDRPAQPGAACRAGDRAIVAARAPAPGPASRPSARPAPPDDDRGQRRLISRPASEASWRFGSAPSVAGGVTLQGRMRWRNVSFALEGRIDLPGVPRCPGRAIEHLAPARRASRLLPLPLALRLRPLRGRRDARRRTRAPRRRERNARLRGGRRPCWLRGADLSPSSPWTPRGSLSPRSRGSPCAKLACKLSSGARRRSPGPSGSRSSELFL